MKKTLCLLSLILIAMIGFAQVQVSQDGNVGVKTENSGASSLEIKPDGNRINLFSHYTYNGTETWPTNGYFQSIINTDQNFRGVYSYVKNQGTGSAYGAWVYCISESSGPVVGIRNYTIGLQSPNSNGIVSAKTGIMNHVYGSGDNNNDSNENRTGMYTNVTGAGSGKRTGMEIVLNGAGTGERTGIYNRIEEGGDGYKHGIDNYISGTGDGIRTGMNNVIFGEGDGIRRGVVNSVRGTGNGSRQGIHNLVDGFVDGPYNSANQKFGIFNEVRGGIYGVPVSDEGRVGIRNILIGAGDGDRVGVSNDIGGEGDGNHTVVLSRASGSGSGIRVTHYNLLEGSGDGQREGLRNYVRGTGGGERYGIRNLTYGDGSNTFYGIYNSVEGDNSTATKYGIYTRVSTINSTNSYALYASNGINYAGYFNGDVHISGLLTTGGSDRRLKRDIQKMGPSLSILMQLQPVTYFFDHPSIKLPEGKQIGLIAQEVEPLIPEVVREVSFVVSDQEADDPENLNGANNQTKDYKVIDYEKLIPVLIKSVQEQQEIIEQQSDQIKSLQKRLNQLENKR